MLWTFPATATERPPNHRGRRMSRNERPIVVALPLPHQGEQSCEIGIGKVPQSNYASDNSDSQLPLQILPIGRVMNLANLLY